MTEHEPHGIGAAAPPGRRGLSRRRFVGYLVAGTTLTVAADLRLGTAAEAAIPSPPQIAALFDLEDLESTAALATSGLIRITIHSDGTASFALPRAEVGQGITTSTAMIIAEELDLPVEKVIVSLAPARPELVFNQLTGGSNSTVSTYTPIRVAASIAKGALLKAASVELGYAVGQLTTKLGVVRAPNGTSVSYGALATKAATTTTKAARTQLKARTSFSVVGTPRNRVDARDIVTGKKQFTMDLQVPDALPTMVCRAPGLNGRPVALRNKDAILRMPGVTDVAVVETGVAVRARTFGQCIDAVRAVQADFGGSVVPGADDASVLRELRKAEIPLVVPTLPLLGVQVDTDFEFMFRSSAALETNCAIADVRDGHATIWSGLKSPIVAQGKIAEALGLPQDKVTVHVVTGGGSFGHKLFHDPALEAARVSQAMGKPVKLMWHRVDEPRQGRMHPMATSRCRATMLGDQVLTFEQRHTSVATDFSHGLGEMLVATAADLPPGLVGVGLSQSIFLLTQDLPYNFGVVTQLLDETDTRFNTGSMRSIYSQDVACASELTVDLMARKAKKDPLAFRLANVKYPEVKAVLEKVAEVGNWGRTMPPGTAQGIAVHREYKGATAFLVEIDCRPETVNRRIRNGVGGPRVTKVVVAVDAGLVINPRGVEAQMMGAASDGIGLALTNSTHLKDGHFLEASWDNYFYTREWNTPFDFECVIMPSSSAQPGGVGEAGVPASFAAVACAYARATGTTPKRFPINHDTLSFDVKPYVPSLPESPTDGLSHTY
ncbi:molybdopterin cofactor-binding domain-containing protein [Flexivirga sp.]|uniref:molybdopterin cofactor-binding domain-containing protein n=1 Tax=Flexivirga sp. TaxID=1962927 RepID=UPI003F7E54B8